MIDVLKQALADAKRCERHNNVAETRYWLNQYKLIAEKAIAELESQELKQVTVKDFVHIVEGKEDLIGRPVYFAQWPNGNTSPPQRTEQEPVADDFFKTIADKNPKPFPPKRTWVGLTDEERSQLVTLCHGWNEYGQAIEAELREKNT